MVVVSCIPSQVSEFNPAHQTPLAVPEKFQASGSHQIDPTGVTGWLNDFDLPLLNQLADEAVSKNFNLQIAKKRIHQAEQRVLIARSAWFPRLDANQNKTRSQNLSPVGQIQSRQHNFELSMSWEIDLWDQLYDLKESEVRVLDAQYHAFQAARLSLVCNVIKSVFELVESEEQIALTEKNLKSLEANLDILDRQLEGGSADERTALEISLSRSDIAREKAELVAEKLQRAEAKRTLEALLTRYPKGLIEGLKNLPDPKNSIPVGLPSDLLLRRPDILEAEQTINSGLYELSAAHKQMLPSLSLTGDLGTSSNDDFFDLLDPEQLVWRLTRNLTAPIFTAGQIQADIKIAELERDALIAEYADVVLTAFTEVEVALSNEKFLNEQVEALKENVKQAMLAESLSQSDYENGIVGIITLLESQQRSFVAQSTLLNVRLQRLLNRMDLYLALGGDFKTRAVCLPPTSQEPQKFKRINKIINRYRPVKSLSENNINNEPTGF